MQCLLKIENMGKVKYENIDHHLVIPIQWFFKIFLQLPSTTCKTIIKNQIMSYLFLK